MANNQKLCAACYQEVYLLKIELVKNPDGSTDYKHRIYACADEHCGWVGDAPFRGW